MAMDQANTAEPATCRTCHYYVEPNPGSGWGECRVQQPVVIPGHGGMPVSVWPDVKCHTFCGRHKRRFGSRA